MTALLLGWALWKPTVLVICSSNRVNSTPSRNSGQYLFLAHRHDWILGHAFAQYGPTLPGSVTASVNSDCQVVALPTTMTVFAAMGVMITSAAV